MPLPIDAWIQYGAFGLLAFLVVWVVWKVFPGFQETHKAALARMGEENKAATIALTTTFRETIREISITFKEEQKQCHDERIAVAQTAAVERDKDRRARQDLIEVIGEMSRSIGKLDDHQERDRERNSPGDGIVGPRPQRRRPGRSEPTEGGT